MSTRRRFLGWGVFLVCLGSVPLAVQLNLIDARSAASIVRLWPLILIGIGLSIALRFTPYRVLGSVLAGGVTGLVVGVFLAGGGASPALACTGGQPSSAPTVRSGSFSGPSANVSIELTCGQIDIARGTEPGWTVAVATNGDMPVIESDANSLELRTATASRFGPFTGSEEHWQLTLPAQTPISAGVTLNAASGNLVFGTGALDNVSATYNAADGRLDLRGTSADGSLSATLNASTVRLLLPDQPIEASITLNVSSLTVCVPTAAALRIGYSNTLGSDNFAAAGLQGGGENWSTPGPATALSSLHISSNLSSISVDRSGECT